MGTSYLRWHTSKNRKAMMMEFLEKDVDLEVTLPNGVMWLFDGMAFIQSLSTIAGTFSGLSIQILASMTHAHKEHFELMLQISIPLFLSMMQRADARKM